MATSASVRPVCSWVIHVIKGLRRREPQEGWARVGGRVVGECVGGVYPLVNWGVEVSEVHHPKGKNGDQLSVTNSAATPPALPAQPSCECHPAVRVPSLTSTICTWLFSFKRCLPCRIYAAICLRLAQGGEGKAGGHPVDGLTRSQGSGPRRLPGQSQPRSRCCHPCA